MRRYSLIFPILLLAICGFVLAIEESEELRNLSIKINPGCNETDCENWNNISLIHIRSDSSADSLHFIWSFHGAPSLLLARTSLNNDIFVDWDAFLSGNDFSIGFTERPDYTFGWSLFKVWMFTDENDDVKLDKVDQSNVYGFDTKDFAWVRENESIGPEEIKLNFVSRKFKHHDLEDNGYFKFRVTVRNSDGYSDILPYMLHNGNISQIDIDFENVALNKTIKNLKKTRVGFELVFAQERESQFESMKLVKDKALDDEHTPGVFETYSIRTPILNIYDQAFLQWKPVCYDAKVRDISDSIDVISYEIQGNTTDITSVAVMNSTIKYYFGNRTNEILIQFANVSFGTQQDGFFEKTRHISWTFLTGYGNPPHDYVSLLVKLVVAIGLGVPAVIILSSGLYVFLKRVSKPKDDLLLGR